MYKLHALFFLFALFAMIIASPIPQTDKDFLTRDPHPTIEQETDGLLFLTPMSSFLAAKAKKQPARLIWSDNGCSNSPDKPDGFNFLPSCQRHDFGYRNYKAQGRCSENERGKIDQNLKKDMYDECAKYTGLKAALGVVCRGYADTYYRVVRGLGESAFC